jgi:8-oxo-dGTP pyrophosphatase MutT (NUDIX family)
MTIPRAAGTLVLAENTGRVLLLHRTDGEGWSHPGGMVEPTDECAEETAIRELVEETGYPPILTTPLEHLRLSKLADGDVVTGDDGDVPGGPVVLAYDLFVVTVREEFVPKLDGEHTAWTWAEPYDTGPHLHPGCDCALRWLTKEYG